jgi:hypothetical protein
MMRRGLLAAIFLLVATGLGFAQVTVSAQTQRQNFLLFERVDVLVTITNIGDNDLELNNDEGRPWLSFMVSAEGVQHSFLPVHSERQSNFAPLALKQGETKTFDVNITPLYSFRAEGNYKVSAVVDLPGEGQMISDPVPFTVQKGRAVVSQVRVVDTLERVYSLVRFSPSSDETSLYLRVEAPSENVVYANLALGKLVSSMDPDLLFDPQGDLHILQPTALGTYLYTRADEDGKVLDQRLFKAIPWQPRPRLTKLDDGSVIVNGGISEDPNAPREKLSDTQQGQKIAAPIAPPDPPPAPPPAQ